MGKREKEHRAKVAKRNQRISGEKSKMQKLFDKILAEQMEKFKESNDLNTEDINDGINIQMGGKPVEFTVVDPNEVEIQTEGNVSLSNEQKETTEEEE
jgi:hypothetical protein